MEKADTYLQRHNASETCTSARDEGTESEVQRENEEKTRECLICLSPFPSAWAGERICRRCKSSARWRSGALG